MPQRRHIAEEETAEERLRQSEARLRLTKPIADADLLAALASVL